MTKTPKELKKKDEIELEPDAWDRFEGAMDKVVKAPPMHREKPDGKKDGIDR